MEGELQTSFCPYNDNEMRIGWNGIFGGWGMGYIHGVTLRGRYVCNADKNE